MLTVITALAWLSLKSMPSLTFPRHTAIIKAPVMRPFPAKIELPLNEMFRVALKILQSLSASLIASSKRCISSAKSLICLGSTITSFIAVSLCHVPFCIHLEMPKTLKFWYFGYKNSLPLDHIVHGCIRGEKAEDSVRNHRANLQNGQSHFILIVDGDGISVNAIDVASPWTNRHTANPHLRWN